MTLLRTLSGFGRIKLTFVLGHSQFFSCSNWTTRKTVKKKKVGRSELKRECNLLGHLPHSSLACTKCCRNNINSSLSIIIILKDPRGLCKTTVSTFVPKSHLRGNRKQTHLKIKILCKGDITELFGNLVIF